MAKKEPGSRSKSMELNGVRLDIPGGLPSGRQLAGILTIFECSLAWTPIALAAAARDQARARGWAPEQGGEEQKRSADEFKALDKAVHSLEKSFAQFLSRKYRSLILEAQSLGRHPAQYGVEQLVKLMEKETKDEPAESKSRWRPLFDLLLESRLYNPERQVERLLRQLSFSGGRFNAADFMQWVAEDIGTGLLTSRKVRQDASLEFLFDVSSIAGIVPVQSSPALDDILASALGILRSWLGKQSNPQLKGGMAPPRLPPSLQRLISQFDDVELLCERNVPRFRFQMKQS